jgi:hypothetical protein
VKFEVYPWFEIRRKPNRHGEFDKTFWTTVGDRQEGLPEACGVYVFALKHGAKITPWYVGKTERRNFRFECFQPAKINYYNDVLVERSGLPLLFLIPRVTASGRNFSKPTKHGYRDIEFLETILIGYALEANPKLANIKKTKLLRDMEVPGIMNSPQARPTSAVQDLKGALGLLHTVGVKV